MRRTIALFTLVLASPAFAEVAVYEDQHRDARFAPYNNLDFTEFDFGTHIDDRATVKWECRFLGL